MILVEEDNCVGCGHCIPYCSAEAITVLGKAIINYDLCLECLTCIDYCPNIALYWEEQ